MTHFDITKVLLTNFSGSKSAEEQAKELKLGFAEKYKLARLAIGRSLGEPSFPPTAPDASKYPLKGQQLFGSNGEELLWVSLLATNFKTYSPKAEFTIEQLQSMVRDHWHRGIGLLLEDWHEAEGRFEKFVEILVTRRALLAEENSSNEGTEDTWQGVAGSVWLTLGKLVDDGAEARWLVNGKGYAPNIALMGQAGSGKTHTMLKLLEQAQMQSGSPVILLDLGKGDLANNSMLAKQLNATVLRVPEQAIPLDMFYRNEDVDNAAHVLQSFRDSFERAMSSKPGPKQLDAFREALRSIFISKERISLAQIKQALDRYYSEKKIKTDAVIATINDLIQFNLFNPVQTPDEFFRNNWIITFGNATETSKKLAAFLLVDALHNYLKRCPESPLDEYGHRSLRVLLAIDEAKPLLAARHLGLSNLLRLHRSKGLCVMLASQSPDDYEGAADDYLEQIGLPVCFRTNANSPKVLNNMFGSAPNFSALDAGVCLSVLEAGGSMQKIKAY
ncbi:DndE family protein [Methylotuvimicrobium sp. KM2]|uniref:DndE family protein n=1 Tax=Methylotuvimicrobium sp. KM2 TaxID=3133976 RepID=UPI003100BCDF